MHSHKRIYPLAAIALFMATVLLLMLCTAPAYARYDNTTTWDGVYGTRELVVESNYLTAEGQIIQLPNWTMKAASSSSRRYDIALFANMAGVQGTISCSSNSEYLNASLNRSALLLPTSLNYDTAKLTLTPTEAALTLEEPAQVTVRVEWTPNQNEEAAEMAEPESLWGEFQVWLVPEPVEETTEPTDPPEETTEPTEEATTPEGEETTAPVEDPSETTKPTEIPGGDTQETTAATTEAPTEEPTIATTEAPTEETTLATTEAPTEETTIATTEAPTEETTLATTDATDPPSETATGNSEENEEDPSVETQPLTNVSVEVSDSLYADEGESVAAVAQADATPLVVNAPSTFSKEEVTMLQILPPNGADQIVITYENVDFEGEFPFDTRYQVNEDTWIMLAEGGTITIENPASEIKLALDFSWVSYVKNANITVKAFLKGEETGSASVSMSNSGTALSVDLSQVQPIIDGRNTISVPFTGEPENLEWRVERLVRKTDGTLAYVADAADFRLAISINGTKLEISNKSGNAPAGTYRLILEQRSLDEVISSVEFPLFIHY